MKYLEALNSSAEVNEKAENELKNEEANLALQSSVLNCKKEIAKVNTDLSASKKMFPLNADLIVSNSNKLDLLERKQKQLESLSKELF